MCTDWDNYFTSNYINRDTIVQYRDKETGSTAYELVEKSGAQYEGLDELREQFDTRKQSNPPKGNYALTQCAAYEPVHPN